MENYLIKNKKYVIWDWNGTLLDDTALCSQIINRLLVERGLPELTLDDHRRKFDFPVKRFYERAGFDFDREPFEKISEKFITTYYEEMETCALHIDALPWLKRFQTAKIEQIVLSASEKNHLLKSLNFYGVIDFFSEALGIDSIHAEGKVEMAKHWIRSSKIKLEDILLIGDTLHDGEVAENLGVDCVLVAQGHHHPERLKASGFPVVPSLKALEFKDAS